MDFGAILKRSKDLTIKNKWLWVYGIVISALSGSSFSSFGNGGGSGSKNTTLPKFPQDISNFTNFISQWVATVPVQTWIMLGLGILLVIVLSITVSMVALAWAKGSLIGGLNDADLEKNVTLGNTTGYGFKSLKNLIVFNLINSLICMGIIITLFTIYGLVALVFSFAQILMILWVAIAGILGFFTLVILMIILAMVGIYAERLIVLKEFTPIKAWKKALAMSKGNFLNTFLMGMINSAVGCSLGCLTSLIIGGILAIPAIIFAIPFFSGDFPLVSIIGLIFMAMVFVYANFIVRAGIVVFNYSNWNQLFKKIYDS